MVNDEIENGFTMIEGLLFEPEKRYTVWDKRIKTKEGL